MLLSLYETKVLFYSESGSNCRSKNGTHWPTTEFDKETKGHICMLSGIKGSWFNPANSNWGCCDAIFCECDKLALVVWVVFHSADLT